MKKLTAEKAQKLYQARFEKTARYVAQMLCKNLDKALRKACKTDGRNCASHTFQIAGLYQSEDYVLPDGMLEWRHRLPEDSENSRKLVKQIVVLVQQYYTGWDVRLMYNKIDYEFYNNTLVFDAKFVAEDMQICRPEDFDAVFYARVNDMVQYFVQNIRIAINKQLGTRSIREGFRSEAIIHHVERLCFNEEEATAVFNRVKEALFQDGWHISICDIDIKKSNMLYPRTLYNFEIKRLPVSSS